MFYRESYNNLWYEKNPQIIEIFDHLLGTLVGDIVNRITVSFIAEKTGMQYEMAKQIVIYYRDVGILKERYVVLCPKRRDILFISDKEDLLEKIQKKPICFECENNDYGQISMSNVFLVYERVKKSTTSQEIGGKNFTILGILVFGIFYMPVFILCIKEHRNEQRFSRFP